MKNNLKPLIKLKGKTTLLYAITSVVTVLIVGVVALFYFNLGTSHISTTTVGDVITSTSSDNWNSAAGWDLNRIPENGDKVIIKAGHLKTITNNTNLNGEIIINGELKIENADLVVNSASKVALNSSGVLSFSPPGTWWGMSYATAHLTIGSNLHWLIGWYNGTIVTTPQSGPIAFGAGADELLPIDLVAFNAALTTEKKAEITWQTASEENNDYFTIERSLDGKNFFVLDTLSGVGNSNKLSAYTYIDDAPVSGYNYYRLTQTDYDGKTETFNVASVFNNNAQPELSIVSIGPNPYIDHFKINFTSIDNSSVHMKMFDMQGRTIFTKSLEAEKGYNTFTYVDQKNLQPGVYLFTIVQKGTPAKTYRLVKDS